MKTFKHTPITVTVTALVVSLITVPALFADENPMQRNVQPQSSASGKMTHGGGWGQGYCNDMMMGDMMGGMMMGGAMPRGLDPAQLPEPGAAGAKLVGQYCTQCHGLPSPMQHSSAGWPATVARMNVRMQWMSRNNSPMNIAAPSEKELRALTTYLEKHAAVEADTPSSGNSQRP